MTTLKLNKRKNKIGSIILDTVISLAVLGFIMGALAIAISSFRPISQEQMQRAIEGMPIMNSSKVDYHKERMNRQLMLAQDHNNI